MKVNRTVSIELDLNDYVMGVSEALNINWSKAVCLLIKRGKAYTTLLAAENAQKTGDTACPK